MTEPIITEEAARWLARQQADDMDWDDFTDWLERDPRHRAAYDEMAMLDSSLDEHAAAIRDHLATTAAGDAGLPEERGWRRWAGFGGAAVAASLALAFAVQTLVLRPTIETYDTKPGQSRDLVLDGGVRATVAPDSHLVVRGADYELAGVAYFDVAHRPGRTLAIKAGPLRITDIGTRFAIENVDGRVRVEVADGFVKVRSDRLARPVALAAGQGLVVDSAKGTARLMAVAPAEVGSWRTGKLRFQGEPLRLVAQEISRYSGTKVSVDRSIADRPFSGIILINQSVPPAQTLANILDLKTQPQDGGIRIMPRAH